MKHLCFVVISSRLLASIIQVPSDQPTIQAGLDAALAGDTVLVDTGRYVENVDFMGKNVVLGSLFLVTGDTSYISTTVIDGNHRGRVVSFGSEEDSTAVLSGFTVTNGYASHGGGIYCNNSRPTLKNLKVIGNSAGFGGGIYCIDDSPTIENVVVSHNRASVLGSAASGASPSAANGGGGIFLKVSNARLNHVTVNGNFAQDFGGGIFLSFASPRLVHVTLNGNWAGEAGGGLYAKNGSKPVLVNSILWDGPPEETYFLPEGDPNAITVVHSDIRGGEKGIASNVNVDVSWLEGNIDYDPMFVGAEYGDLNLKKGSVCIDAGTAFYVWERDTLVNLGDTLYQGLAPDMGSLESPFTAGDYTDLTYPRDFTLHQNYPNPFNRFTEIRYEVRRPGQLDLAVYDLSGREVVVLETGWHKVGGYSVYWEGAGVPSGIYVCRLFSGVSGVARKMILVK